MIDVVSSKEDGFIAIKVPRAAIGELPPEATHILLRFKTPEGFKAFMLSAMDAAAAVWPDIAKDWEDEGTAGN